MHWDWDTLGPIGAFLGIIGTGIAWIYDRWAQRVEKREARMIELWKERAAEARKDADAARRDASKWRARAMSWHSQLLRNDIEPDPPMGGDDL